MISQEAVGTSWTGDSSSPWSISGVHNSSGGPNTVVFVGLSITPSLTSTNFQFANIDVSITYGGQTMMLVGYCSVGVNENLGAVYIYALWNPPSGTQNIIASMTNEVSVSTAGFTGMSVSYTGVGGIRAVYNDCESASSTHNITVASTPGHVLLHVGGDGGASASSYNQTLIDMNNSRSGDDFIMGEAPGAASVTFQWSGASVSAGHVVAELVPVEMLNNIVCIQSIGLGERTATTADAINNPWTHTTQRRGDDVVAVVCGNASNAENNTDLSMSATFGGVAMTQVGFAQAGSSSTRSAIGIFVLRNPPVGDNTVQLSTSGTASQRSVIANSVVYERVRGIGSVVEAATTGLVVPSYAGGKVIHAASNGTDLTALTSHNEVYRDGASVLGAGDWFMMQSANGTGGNVTFTAPGTASNAYSMGLAVEPLPSNQFFALFD